MKWASLSIWLFIFLFCTRANADSRPVIVLLPDHLGSDEWSEGTQAVIAELSANGFQVIEQRSHAETAGELLSEVAHVATSQSTLGVVAVLREGDTGAAYVWTEHGEHVLRDDSSGTHGAVAEGAVALRVVEFLRTETLKFPIGVSVPQRPQKPEKRGNVPTAQSGRFSPWLGISTVVPTIEATMPLNLSGGASVRTVSTLSVDLTARVSVVPGRFDTGAGRFSLSSEELGGRLMFDPMSNSQVTFAVGLGVSSLWLQESATGNVGFRGKSDSTQVMLVAARARLTLRSQRWFGVVVLDPGLTVPQVSVGSNLGQVARLGRPWLATEVGVGWAF
jgi:hypothetical protein